MEDCLAHYYMFDYKARCAVAVTTEVVREAQRRHNLDPVTTIAVGRAISSAALLASTLKEGTEYVHCSFAADGLLQKVIGECNGDGHCRGYSAPARLEQVLPDGESMPQSVGEATGGAGVLTVTRGRLGEHSPYHAVSNFLNGEIASDVARFLTESEQVPSAVVAGVKLSTTGEVLGAGGVLVQRLGGADIEESVIAEIERRMTTQLHVSDRIAGGATLDELVELIAGVKDGWGLLKQRRLVFACTCSREKMAAALFSLGESEVRAIEEETGKIEVRCQYCGATHGFRREELVSH